MSSCKEGWRGRFKKLLLCGGVAGAALMPLSARALDPLAMPTGGSVTSGAAVISSPAAGQLNINQTSDRAVIQWQGFNIGQNAVTEFFQPSATSVAVNRVVSAGVNPTEILGTLKANGRVMVLDPNGVLFGAGSVVDVGGIVASTGDLDLAAFNAGSQQMTISSADTGSITNLGDITIKDGGLLALVAPTVTNSGVIHARLGSVSLAAGKKATLDFTGDKLIQFTADGAFSGVLVRNDGQVLADGGTVRMDAFSAKSVIDTIINTSGIVRADKVGLQDGKIVLSSGIKGRVNMSGMLSASGSLNVSGAGADVTGDVTTGAGSVAIASTTATLDGKFLTERGTPLDRTQLSGTVNLATVVSNRASIQQAIDITATDRATFVKVGDYGENIDIYKRITVQGELAGTAIPTLSGTAVGGSVVTITADGAKLDRMGIAPGASLYGARVDGRTGVQLTKNVFTGFGASGAGLYLTNTISNIATQNIFISLARGILAENNTLLNIISNSFKQAVLGAEVTGTFQLFQIMNNTFEGGSTGVKIRDIENALVKANTMTDVALGVDAENLGVSRFRGNWFMGSGVNGMAVANADAALIDNNFFSGLRDALAVDSSDNVTILGNVFATPDEDIAKWGSASEAGTGLKISNSSGTLVQDNYLDDAYTTGVYLTGSTATSLIGNLIAHNAYGLESTGGVLTLADNLFDGNGVGSFISGNTALALQGVNSFTDGDVGLVFYGKEVSLAGNTLGQTEFSGQSQYYVALRNRAFFDTRLRTPTIIEARNATFDGVLGSAASAAQIQGIENKLFDQDDDKTLGQIFAGDYMPEKKKKDKEKVKGDHNNDGHLDNGWLKKR